MRGWTDGYVTEIPYTHGFHPELMPAAMMAALADRGQGTPIKPDQPFDYCELGFGQGFSMALMAAANPRARFWGNDFNPDHVGHVRDLAQKAGLSNLTVSERGFADYDDGSLPDFDIIALHGVWSWVGADARAEIKRFIDRRLKPGGIVYLGYNCLPGWAQYLPLRQLMLAEAARVSGPLADRIAAGLDLAARLEGQGAGYFRINPTVGPRRELLSTQPAAYLAHEYFNQSWEPVYFTDLAAELAPLGLRFAAQARPADRWEEGTQEPALTAVGGDGADDPVFIELLRDYLTNRPFRRDLFQRDGGDPYRPGEQTWVATGHVRDLPRRATLAGGTVIDLPFDEAHQLLAGLAAGPVTVKPLAAALGQSAARVAELLRLLAALGLAAPAQAVTPAAQAACDRLNRVILDSALEADRLCALASPVLGGGVAEDRVGLLFLAGWGAGDDPADFAWETLAAGGQRLLRDGKPLGSEKENRRELMERWERFRQRRLPLLTLLGATQQERTGQPQIWDGKPTKS